MRARQLEQAQNRIIIERPATVRESIETEFIPSLGFDFGSDQDRKDYFEALEKGLLPSDGGVRRIDQDAGLSDNVNVSAEKLQKDVQQKSFSDVMDNFKDTEVIMSVQE